MHEAIAALLIRLEDAISNIDYPGSDSPYWEAKAIELSRELAARADVEIERQS
ncbi:polyprotein [Microbacterium sp. HM58-2]|nr:polyprotein [Microbacterium sp. HM58-2]